MEMMDVHLLKEQDMLSLAKYQRYLYKHPKLQHLFLELTDKCNLNCLHCGSGCTRENDTFLPLEVIERTLRIVADAYTPSDIMICITGGEPFLHPELFEIVRLSHSYGFAVGITTNGTFIDEAATRKLARAGLDSIAVSLDGLGNVHDDFRRTKGCFGKAVDGIHALKSAGIEPQVLTVVHKGNVFGLEEMFRFLQKEEIYSWRLVNIEPIGRAGNSQDLFLSVQELKYLLDYIRGKRLDEKNTMEVSYGCSHFLTYEYENMVRDFYFQCIAGTKVASIMANGDIGACLDIERRPDPIQGNAYKDDFIDVWENRFGVFRTDRTEKSGACINCRHRTVCLGDSAHTWDFDQKEPRYCVAVELEELTI